MKRPAFVAFITAFSPMARPCSGTAHGHWIIILLANLKSTGLFRQLPLDEVPTLQQWLWGPSAIEAVDSPAPAWTAKIS